MKRWFVQLVILAAAGLALADSSVPARRETPPAGEKRSTRYIVPQERAHLFYYTRKPVVFWTPSTADVKRLEDRLPDLVEKSRALTKLLPKWGRQYVGFVGAQRRKVIWVNLFCVDSFDLDPTQPFVVSDGGECFCRADYDVVAGTFSNFNCNGEG
ncbi:MAG TPA: hypothetical protein VFF06_33105 [Polyangia bacterium]|nr:hypothetical protein [Polyangia bacterium]